MKDIKKTNNYILGKLLNEFDKKGTKIEIKYSKENFIEIKGKGFDYEELSFFLMGILMEAYDKIKPNLVFNMALTEALTNLNKTVRGDLKEVLAEDEEDRED